MTDINMALKKHEEAMKSFSEMLKPYSENLNMAVNYMRLQVRRDTLLEVLVLARVKARKLLETANIRHGIEGYALLDFAQELERIAGES